MKSAVKKETKIDVPVRADIAGGTSDIAYYLDKYEIKYGAVVNIALPVRIEITVSIDESSDEIRVTMPDLNETIKGDISDLEKQEENNACQIIKNFLRFFALNSKGLNVKITSKGAVPPASGLGTSSAIGVGLVRALSEIYGVYGINPCEFSYLVETSMGMLGGKQDYYAAWLEGLNYIIFSGPDKSLVTVKRNYPSEHKLYRWVLEKSVIYYTGESRSSGKMNEQFQENIKKDPSVFSKIAQDADRAFKGIRVKNEEMIAESINSDRIRHLKLSPLYYSKSMTLMAKVGEELGYAHRGCGAGGGGCILFFGDKKNHDILTKKLNKLGGFKIY